MIERIELKSFKCFKHSSLPLAPLTLLTGANASGKSTILQALAALSQTMTRNEWSNRLMLNGPLVQLGTVDDVIDQTHGGRQFALGIQTAWAALDWRFVADDRKAMSAALEGGLVDGVPWTVDGNFVHYLLSLDDGGSWDEMAVRHLLNFEYLTAERLGPRTVYPLPDPHTVSSVGPRGEHAPGLLYRRSGEEVDAIICKPDEPSTMLGQVNAWMNAFFPGCGVRVTPNAGSDTVSLGLRTSKATDFLRPGHVGFGLTQVLPIVVAALSALRARDTGRMKAVKDGKPVAPPPRDVVLAIENPEVHLHPAGQSAMGQFLAQVADAGVQVILETHSDHVLNGVRRAVKSEVIAADKTMLYFFRDRTKHSSQVVRPVIQPSGAIDDWPDGFFDQLNKDQRYFVGWGE